MNGAYGVIAELRERVEYLEEELRRKDEALNPKSVPLYEGLHLTNKEALFLEALMASRSVCTREHAMNRLYSSMETEPQAPKILDVFMSKLRNKLRMIEVDVETIWGRGWRLSDDNKAKVVSIRSDVPAGRMDMALAGSKPKTQVTPS